MAEKSGLPAALDVVEHDQAPPVEDEPEQLDLMPLADWGEPGGVVGGPAVAAGGSAHNVAGKRKAGRRNYHGDHPERRSDSNVFREVSRAAGRPDPEPAAGAGRFGGGRHR